MANALIRIYAPISNVRFWVVGARFDNIYFQPIMMPACTIQKFQPNDIVIGHTRPDDDSPAGHLALFMDLIYDPLSSGSLQCTTENGAIASFEHGEIVVDIPANTTDRTIHQWIGFADRMKISKP